MDGGKGLVPFQNVTSADAAEEAIGGSPRRQTDTVAKYVKQM